jgi:TfoX/Sxy family transcriptional regulator of competence genes
VAYDEVLADRIRDLLAADADVTERKMFGGLAFLVGGHLAVAASREGGLLVRVDPAQADRLLEAAEVSPMEMRGREMHGWLRVGAGGVRTKRQLDRWVGRAVTFARALPPR